MGSVNVAKISKFDKLWLNEVLNVILQNKRPSYRVIRTKLYKELPIDYNPQNIDKRYAQFNGEDITLEGVHLVKPELDIINKSNRVIFAIKDLLLANPEKEVVTCDEIADKTGLDKLQISFILRLITQYGNFWRSASGSQEFQYGYSEVNFQNDKDSFNQYIHFTDIKDLIKKSNLVSAKDKFNYSRSDNNYLPSKEKTGVSVNPIFKSRISSIDKNLCFVLMPFKESWSNEIYKLIKKTIESMGIQCLRADNLHGPIIIEDIWAKINQAGFVIADVTTKNPNVMYEVGIAHTVGRPTILLTQNIEQNPFDITHLRHIIYRNTASGIPELKKKLKEVVANIYEKDLSNENYILPKTTLGLFSI